MTQKKRGRALLKQQIKAFVGTIQEVVAASLIQALLNKQCIAGLGTQVIAHTHERIIPGQMSIDAALTRPVIQKDLRAANNAALTTAVADFFHAENIADRALETARFQNVIDRARCVGSDYRLPNRKDIAGCLLDVNAGAYKTGNFVAVTKEGPKFGYTFEGDGTTVITKPLLNVMVMQYTTARLREARIMNEFDYAKSGEVGFEDDDLDFDANLGTFGVSVSHLKSPHKESRRFEAWMTEKNLIWWKKNDAVDEEHLLQKFKGLRFYFPDKDAVYKVCDKNLDWKKNHGWVAIAEKEGGSDSDDEPLALALVCELVAANVDKNEGIEIVTATEKI